MTVTRQKLVETALSFSQTPYAHQGRSKKHGVDCGGLILLTARELGLSDLEILGYSSFPNNGRFEQLLNDHADNLNHESTYPHNFSGTEYLSGDILAFDYANGEGVRHAAFVTKFDGRRYWILHAIPTFGVVEMPLSHPYSNARIMAFRVRGVVD